MAVNQTGAVPISERITLSVPEAAQLLGISDKHLWGFVYRKDLPSVRLGGRVMILRSVLDQWVESKSGEE